MVSYKHAVFNSQNIIWWTGNDDYLWIIVMFLSAIWILILMAPIHRRQKKMLKVVKTTYN